MGLFDKLGTFLRREAKDVEDIAVRARDHLDRELSEREAELQMTPAEKLRALQRKSSETESKFERIAEKIAEQTAAPPEDLPPAPPPPVAPQATDGAEPDGGGPRRPGPYREPTFPGEVETGPSEGDLAWVAPRPGEEAVVPAFRGRSAAASSSSQVSRPAPEADTPEPPTVASPEPEPDSTAAGRLESNVDDATGQAEAADPRSPAKPHGVAPDQGAGALSEPSPAKPHGVAPDTAEREDEAARDEARPNETAPDTAEPPPDPAPLGKTPAQLRYEEARAAADALLEELRGELRRDGDI